MDYQTMLANAQANPDSVDFFKLRIAYTQTADYQPYRSDRGLVLRLENLSPVAAIERLNRLLAVNYLDIFAHFLMVELYEKIGDQAKAQHHIKFAGKLIDSIFDSGNGRSFQTAYIVISVDEEYALLNVSGAEMEQQSLAREGDHEFDILDVRHRKTGQTTRLYFNIDLPKGVLRKQNESEPVPAVPNLAELYRPAKPPAEPPAEQIPDFLQPLTPTEEKMVKSWLPMTAFLGLTGTLIVVLLSILNFYRIYIYVPIGLVLFVIGAGSLIRKRDLEKRAKWSAAVAKEKSQSLPSGEEKMVRTLRELGIPLNFAVTDPESAFRMAMAKTCIYRAYQLIQVGKWEPALTELMELIDGLKEEQNSHNNQLLGVSYFLCGVCNEKQKQNESALNNYREAVKYYPEHAEAQAACDRLK